jgi:hypothetical protein
MIQYFYLIQIAEYTKGELGPQQILHAAANGLISLYAHTPEMTVYGSRLSLISEQDCPIVEIEYNAYCSLGDSGEFTECEFILLGEITAEMRDGSQPFNYNLVMPTKSIRDLPPLQKWEVGDEGLKSQKVIAKLRGSDFVVLKRDIDALLSVHSSPDTHTDHQNGPPTTADDDSEIARLQRTVAGLALGLMREYPKYRHGDKPNISKLTDLATDHLRSEHGDRPPHGFGKSTISDAIKAALERYRDLNE